MRNILALIVLIVLSMHLHSETNVTDSLQSRLSAYNHENPVNCLYVHIDRNEYAPGDTIWLKAYMMTPMANDALFTRIVDKNNRIVKERQFVVQDIRSNGEVALSDTMPEGEYQFVAYMDRMVNFDPENVFVQPFRIDKNMNKTLEVDAFVSDVNKLKIKKNVDVVVKVKNGDVKNVSGVFNLFVNNWKFKSGKFKTNNQGENTILFKYPDIENNQSVRCEIVLTRGGESANLVLNLRHEGNSISVNAFPEGGHLLAGVENTLVFETRDDSKSPVATTLKLLNGKTVVGNVSTNELGIGELTFVPKDSTKYTIQVFDNGTNKVYPLPCPVESAGCALHVTFKGDLAEAQLSNVGKAGTMQLLLRSFDSVLWSRSIVLRQGESKSVDLPVSALPAGVLSLIATDESGKTYAERLFMNKNTQEYNVVLGTTKKVKKGIQTFGVDVDVTDKQGNPVLANLSVSVAEKSTVNLKEYRSILQSYYFHSLRNINNRNFDERSSSFDLRMKASQWVNYSWDSISTYQPQGYLSLMGNTGGQLFQLINQNGKAPIDYLVIKTRSWSSRNPFLEGKPILDSLKITPCPYNVNTSYFPNIERVDTLKLGSNNLLTIPSTLLRTKSNEEKIIDVRQDFFERYSLKEINLIEDFDNWVRISQKIKYIRPYTTYAKYIAPPVKAFGKTVQLKDIDIFGNGKALRLSDIIGDYYCLNYVLNCPNHSVAEGFPIIGRVYSTELSKNNNQLVVYNGSKLPFYNAPKDIRRGAPAYIPLRTINEPSVFYNPAESDTSFFKGDIRATVYWNPNLNTLQNGKAHFDFNLSTERKSEFIILIQGIDVRTYKPIFCTYTLKP